MKFILWVPDATAGHYKVFAEASGTIVPNTINTFLTRISVNGGELLGLWASVNNLNCFFTTASNADVAGFETIADPSPGTSVDFTAGGGPFPNNRVDISAAVEPDADHDGYGDETQAKADLAIAKGAPATATVGGNLTYTLTATNRGPEAAPGVVASDPVPTGATLVSVASTAGACDSTVKCSLGTLASGASATIVITVKPAHTGTLTNTAAIDSAALDTAAANWPGRGDTNASNNSASATTAVAQPLAHVSGATITHRRFRVAPVARLIQLLFSAGRPPIGTTFKFRLDNPTAVRLDFTQPGQGRKAKGKCVARTNHNKRKPKCALVRGSLTIQGRAGLNTVKFYGWLSRGHKLKPGKYTLVITATTPGVGSTSQKLTFKIVK